MFQALYTKLLTGTVLLWMLLMGPGVLRAQTLDFYKSEKILVTDLWFKKISSDQPPQIIQPPQIGDLSVESAGDEYILRYDNQGTAEYDTLIFSANQKLYAYVFKNQFVVARDDYFMTEAGVTLRADVLSNDTAYQSATLTDIPFSEGVEAELSGEKIKVEAARAGLYYVYYTICDEFGNCDVARLTLLVTDPETARDTVVFTGVTEPRMTLPLPDEHYRIARSDIEGIMVDDAGFEVEFSDHLTGKKEILFESDGGRSVLYQIYLTEKWSRNKVNRKDRVFMQPGNEVTVDLTENDLYKANVRVDQAHPDLLIEDLGEGKVRIETPEYFIAKTEFSYITCGFSRCDTAKVLVFSDHFQPARDSFDVYVNPETDKIIPFYTLADRYILKVSDQPEHGALTVTEDGKAFRFQPDADFGEETVARIEFSHPVKNAPDFISTHYLRFLNSQSAVPAACDDCIWPGDTDQNGVVDMGDVENIARYIGAKGSQRPDNGEWTGREGEPWMNFEEAALHHFDTDGDGVISVADVSVVTQHFGKTHGIFSGPVIWRDVPVEITVNSPTVEPGQEIVLEFLIGDEEHPLDEINGFSAEIKMEGVVIPYESVEILKDQKNWLKSYQPTLTLKAPSGNDAVNVGEFRVRSIGVDGHGRAMKVGIIVEDEIEGFRTSRSKSRHVKLMFRKMTLHAGKEEIRLPDQILELPLKEKETVREKKEEDLKVFPVPVQAGDYLQAVWDSEVAPGSAELYDLTGKLVRSYDLSGGLHRARLDVSAFPQGVYVLKFLSEKEAVIRKVVIH